MQLRDHPMMTYRGVSNWPPVWTHAFGSNLETVTGDVGMLEDAAPHESLPQSCVLRMVYRNQHYVGCLMFDDPQFRSKICELLQFYLGRSIEEIGKIDLEC